MTHSSFTLSHLSKISTDRESTPLRPSSSPSHSESALIEERQRRHVLFTWSAQSQAMALPISHGEGAIFFDHDGHRWFDFESQVFNCNLGHGDQRVIQAIQRQAQELACAHPAASFEAKARLGELLAEITPGDMSHFFLCLSGSEAIENAYKMARLVTGRKKVIARRRSYHGASMGALSLTGDERRIQLEPGLWGVLRAEDPYCYRCPFQLDPSSCSLQCATHIEHIIQMEGADQVAALFVEGVTGSNGGFIPPPEYWRILREICDRYGVLLVVDEVFSGFGRTGHWFAVDHWGVVPDLITMAKGLTSGYAPMGALAMRPHIAEHFKDQKLWCGLTSYAHPISCAAAVATIEAYRESHLIEAAHERGLWLTAHLSHLQHTYSWCADGRCLGLFGTIEFIDELPASFFINLQQGLRSRYVHALIKEGKLFITPPLCITQTQLEEGLSLVLEAIEESLKMDDLYHP